LAAEGCAILAGHGATAVIPRPLVEGGGEAADLIAAELARLEAGLLVMGAFGERSFAEWLFGSTTRDLLARAEPAVFLYAERDGAEPPAG
ncbi:MAG TPA: universal stress protein, partial [Geminicoccaceae bacterium]